jgi:hypothetical protein
MISPPPGRFAKALSVDEMLAGRPPAADVLIAVEIVFPHSVCDDLLVKRVRYARAGSAPAMCRRGGPTPRTRSSSISTSR